MLDSLTTPQSSCLIQFLLAHLLADFAFQTKWMIDNKTLVGKGILVHILIVFMVTGLATGLWLPAVVVSFAHYVIDIGKYYLQKKYPRYELKLFYADQLLHLITIFLVWGFIFQKAGFIIDVVHAILSDRKAGIIALGYCICIWPLGHMIGLSMDKLMPPTKNDIRGQKTDDMKNGGMLIGIFERIIIFTLVLLGKYEAIGFLITGKSLLRINSKEQTEYVLAGTLMSYALSIMTGVAVNYFLKF